MLKVIEKFQAPLTLAINKRSSLFKNEDVNYVSAFLSNVRQKLLPFHSRSLANYPTKQELDKMYNEIYSELNDLFIDEHGTMGNNDFLEQSYDIFSNIHKLVRKYELVYDLKLEENRKKFNENDPNLFPIYNLTGNDNEPDLKTIWELKDDFKNEFEELAGHFLYLNNSKIEHPDSGKGVFLSCKNRKFVLPGTLLGFYPGIIYFNYMKPSKNDLNSIHPYLKRYDGIWLDPYKKIPYPFKHDLSIEDWQKQEDAASALTGTSEINYKTIPISYTNPLAVGHKINHPPSDISANVKFIDIQIPYNFFPNEFLRYLPNIFEGNQIKKERNFSNSYRTVGIISMNEIKNDEELYVDYIDEDMVPDTYRPDWLLKPPPRNPYLIKKEYVTKPNILDNLIHKIYISAYGKESIEFKKYITREQGFDLIRANSNIKKLQSDLRLGIENDKLKELGSDNKFSSNIINTKDK